MGLRPPGSRRRRRRLHRRAPRRAAGAGAGVFLAAPRDGGRWWSLQLGRAGPPIPPVTRLHFFDRTHGWAVRDDGTVVRTTDGLTWTALDERAPGPLAFIGPALGFRFEAGAIQRTDDGGLRW